MPVIRYSDTWTMRNLTGSIYTWLIMISMPCYGDSAATLLVYSILYNKNSVTQYLIDKGADVNQYVNGKSPLMYAA